MTGGGGHGQHGVVSDPARKQLTRDVVDAASGPCRCSIRINAPIVVVDGDRRADRERTIAPERLGDQMRLPSLKRQGRARFLDRIDKQRGIAPHSSNDAPTWLSSGP